MLNTVYTYNRQSKIPNNFNLIRKLLKYANIFGRNKYSYAQFMSTYEVNPGQVVLTKILYRFSDNFLCNLIG